MSQIQAYAYAISELKEILGNTAGERNVATQIITFQEKLELNQYPFNTSTNQKPILLQDLSIKIQKEIL